MNVRKYIILPVLGSALSFVILAAWSETHYGQRYSLKSLFSPPDTTVKRQTSRQPTYKPQDRYGDPYTNPPSQTPLQLKDPDNIQQEVELDTATGDYIIRERIGDMDYRPQTYMTFEEFYAYKNQQMLREYWQKKGPDPTGGNKQAKTGPYSLRIPVKGLEGPFGSNYVDIRPNGLVTLDFAGRWQRVNNPALPIRQQRTGTFDFDQQISMNVVGKIGEKLKLTVNWDTKAAFEFQNNVKVAYTAFEEDIIQAIEVGRVNMPLNSSLMTGPQNLFGFKTKLQFGRLSVTSVIARQDGKVDEIKISGGGQGRTFEIRADGYEEYRHFFLSQFFRDNYEKSLKTLPGVYSGVKVSRVEVYVTNRNNTTTNLRNVAGYMDLGENDTTTYNKNFTKGNSEIVTPASNNANNVYEEVKGFRDPTMLSTNLEGLGYGIQNGTDYTYLKSARKLAATEFTFNQDLGYITLQTPIRKDEALLVSYEYSYNSTSYKVGELTDDYSNFKGDSLIILKMIKPPVVNTRIPTWDLMMKNIYPLGVNQLQSTNFQFRIIYKDDASGADIPTLQEGIRTKDVPLLQLAGLDALNPNNDPAPDGNFDYIEGVTIDSKNGRIIFPVLEPFGSHLGSYFDPATEQELINKYEFFELYDSTQSDAQQIASKNKFYFKGRYNAGTASEIILPGINVAQGSVTVIAGSNTLTEGVDYTVDYNLGRIKIINEGVLASGQEIRIRFEKQDLFNFRRKSFMGTRFDYKVNKNILVGGTVIHSNEAPNITRVNIGDEPASNTIIGLDANIKQDSRLLTRAVDLLPLISTKAPSNISFQGEGATFLPGYNKIVDKNGEDEGGIAFIDDFEASKTPYDLTRTPIKWRIASTPQRFADSRSGDSLEFAYHRAKLAWYNIDNVFYRSGNNLPDYLSYERVYNHFERNITQKELFPNQDQNITVTNITTLDLAYYPAEKGPYNYNTNLTANGQLPQPTNSWAGVTRDLRNDIDFDNANIQYVEFWLMSPYVPGTSNGHTNIDGVPFDPTNAGKLYINLGSISEDVLRDDRQSFENGIPVNDAQIPTNTVETDWGRVTNQQFINDAFDNATNAREKQDIGLDGLNDAAESEYFSSYAAVISATVTDPTARGRLLGDVSGDNFQYYLGSDQDAAVLSILQRYKNYNGTQNNSPVNSGATFTPANSTTPDNEDLNGDNTLNTIEEYYEYEIDINQLQFQVGQNYIVSSRSFDVTLPDPSGNNPTTETVTWYQFRVPIRNPDSIIGNINGFKSIKFIRAYLTGFKSPVVLRMAQFQLVANQWRVYQPNDINETGAAIDIESGTTVIQVSTVNIEENSTTDGQSTPYMLPPGFNRDYDATSTVTRRLNEQSLRLCVDNLDDGSARAVYKNTNLNLMNYKQIDMFIHAETQQVITDGTVTAFIRFGTDFKDNYYEIEVPLYFTNPINSTDESQVWRSENQVQMLIKDLIDTKVARNAAGFSLNSTYRRTVNGKNIIVVGNPDMSAVVTVMLGLRNPTDDRRQASFCIWADELRASGYVDHASYAYAAKLNLKLADFATVNSSIRFTSAGFGNLDQKTSQRERSNTLEYGINSNINLDKFIPSKVGLRLPMYIGYNRKVISPQYDPLNPDVSLKQSVNNAQDPDGYKDLILDQTATRALNFTGIQKVKTKPDAKKHIYDIENLVLSLGYSETKRTSYDIKNYTNTYYNASLAYTYSATPKNFEPFKNMADSKNPVAQLIKAFNVTLLPSQYTFKTNVDRRLITSQYYQQGPLSALQKAQYEKSFTYTRTYGLQWNFTKSITGTYNAAAYSVVDEPLGTPGGKAYSDSLLSNFLKFGRLKNFDQKVSLNYKLPLDKVKALNWLSADYTYGASYNWTSGALKQRDTLGNIINNKRDNSLNGKIDFEKLYSKSKFLTTINNLQPKSKNGPAVRNPNDTLPPKPDYRALKLLMMIKNANFTYTQAQGSQVSGFLPIPKYFGLTDVNDAGTMLPFILGSQDPAFRLKAADKGWISHSRSLNSAYTQIYTQTVTARVNVEPIKGLKIQIDGKYTKASNFYELFRVDSNGIDPLTNTYNYVSDAPTRSGSYNMSYLSIFTAFDKHVDGSLDPNSSNNFQKFSAYRVDMLGRLNNSKQDSLSQDVLIPAFLAAYGGKSPSKVSLNPFPKTPLPNWKIDYTLDLSKVRTNKTAVGTGPPPKPELKKRGFKTITFSHQYTSLYSVGSFVSSNIYNSNYIMPGTDFNNMPRGDSTNINGNLIPVYVINEVSIREAFSPFLGINIQTMNKVSYKLVYNRSRALILGLNNSQLREDISNDYTFGFGLTRSNVMVPKFLTGGQKRFLKNELTVRCDMTVRQQVSYQRKFDENTTITAGNTNFQLKPSISYNLTQRVTLMVYFERTFNNPRISSSFRRATTAFGVQLRFTLS